MWICVGRIVAEILHRRRRPRRHLSARCADQRMGYGGGPCRAPGRRRPGRRAGRRCRCATASRRSSIGRSSRRRVGRPRDWSRFSSHFPAAATCRKASSSRRCRSVSTVTVRSISDQLHPSFDSAGRAEAPEPRAARPRLAGTIPSPPARRRRQFQASTSICAPARAHRKAPPATARGAAPDNSADTRSTATPGREIDLCIEVPCSSIAIRSVLEPKSSDFSPDCALSPPCSVPIQRQG